MKPLTAEELRVLFAYRQAIISPSQAQQMLLICCDSQAEFGEYMERMYRRFRDEVSRDVEAMQLRIVNNAINERRMP